MEEKRASFVLTFANGSTLSGDDIDFCDSDTQENVLTRWIEEHFGEFMFGWNPMVEITTLGSNGPCLEKNTVHTWTIVHNGQVLVKDVEDMTNDGIVDKESQRVQMNVYDISYCLLEYATRVVMETAIVKKQKTKK